MSITADTAENIGDQISEGISAVINGDSPASPYAAFSARSTKPLSASRVECRSGAWLRATDQMNLSPSGDYYYNHRRGAVLLTVISQRHTQEQQGADSNHGVAVGRCRWLMSRAAQKLIPSVVGGYQILDIVDQGDSYLFDQDTSTDRTEMRFQIDLVIPPAIYSTQ